jgi:hypothetical protein
MSRSFLVINDHRGLAFALLLALLMAFACYARNANGEGANSANADAAAYRRVFVPVDSPELWPTRGEPYLPIDRKEFERLTQAAADRRELSSAGPVQISRATYTAQLQDGGSLSGSAQLDVQLIDEAPQILPLTPWNLTLQKARWNAGPDEGHAEIGAWKRPGQQAAEPGVLVDRSDTLAIDWELSHSKELARELEFRLQLPPALRREFAVDLPPNYTASLTPGVRISNTPTADESSIRWTFRMASSAQHLLRIQRPAATPSHLAQAPLVAVTDEFSVSPSGLECETKFRVQFRELDQSELRLTVPPELRLSQVLVNEEPAAWQNDPQDARAVTVELPRTDQPIDVLVRAAGGVEFGRPWNLPRIVAQDALQTEGAATLWVHPELELQSIEPQSASLVNQVGIASSEGGEAFRLQSWSDDASIEVVIAPKSTRAQVDAVVVAEFADRELIGKCEARLWAEGGPLLHVEAKVEPQWNVESVEARPAEALARWHVVGDGPDQRLHLQLQRSPTKGETIDLFLSARKPLRGWAPVAKLGELDWLHFPAAANGVSLLQVADRQGRALSVSRDAGIAVRSLESLTTQEQSLLAGNVGGLLLAPNVAPRRATVRVTPSAPGFQSQAWIELSHADAGFTHSAELLCQPIAGAISELTILAARRLPTDAQWAVVGSNEQPVAVETSSLATQSTTPAEYRVRLARPRSEAFRLRATWRGNRQGADSIVSLVVPKAERWQSWALLRGNPTTVEADANGCAPAAATPDADGDGPPLVGCYRLGDDPSAPVADAPRLTRRQAVAGDLSGVTCWRRDVTTLQFPDGNQSHRIAYELEVHAPGSIRIQAPTGLRIVSARLDDAAVPLASPSEGKLVQIALPNVRNRARVTVDLHGKISRLGSRAKVQPAMPETPFTPVRGHWTVAAPPPYAVEAQTASKVAAGWRQRLFGPLVDPTSGQTSPIFGLGATLDPATNGIEEQRESADTVGGFRIPQHWSRASQAFVAAPTPMEIRRLDDSRAAWHVIWLCSVVIAAIAWPSKPRWVISAGTIAALACLVLPLPAIIAPQAVFLGLVAGAVVRQILQATARITMAPASQRQAGIAIILLLAVSLPDPRRLQAAENAAPPPAVFYPVDEDGRAAGRDLYAPASLLSKLLPPAVGNRSAGAEWKLRELRLELQLVENSVSKSIECGLSTLRLQVQTFRPNVEVRLPLVRDEADEYEVQTTDGAPLSLQWNEETTGCSVRLPNPGTHSLEIKLRPRTRRTGGTGAMTLHVPPALDAAVQIDHPAGLDVLTVNSIRVVPKTAPEGRTAVRLPPAETTEVSWPHRRTGSQKEVTVDTFSRLVIEPAAARLEVDLRLTGEAASVGTLELATPPQLKLLPTPPDSPIADAQVLGGLPGTTVLKLQGPLQLPRTIRIRFQVQRGVSLGKIDFPIVRPLGMAAGTTHFAVLVDPRLRLRDELRANLTPASLAELESLWGTIEPTPFAQYAAAGGDTAWEMQVEPAPPQYTPRESMTLLCSSSDARITYEAAVDNVVGDVWTCRLHVPNNLELTDVAVMANGEAVALRWSRPRPEELFVLLAQPLKGPHRLRVTGRVPYEGREVAIPTIGFQAMTASPITVDVARTSDVLAEWVNEASAPPQAADQTANSEELLVGRYVIERQPEKMPALSILPNEARVSADALLSLDFETGEPMATAAIHLRALRGMVDRVRLEVGKNWVGPLTADAGAKVITTSPARSDGRRVIEIQLATPVAAGQEVLLRISGPAALDNDQQLRFPDLRLIATEQRVFLKLPKTPDDQSSEWTLRGVQRAHLPDDLAEALASSEPGTIYRVGRDRFVAVQRVFPLALRNAAVRLAETRVAIDHLGQWSATSQLIVQPGTTTALAIELPDGAELLHASIDGGPVPATTRQKRLELPPGARFLPRIVVVAYRRSEPQPRRVGLRLPTVLAGGKRLAVTQALWEIEGEPGEHLVFEDAKVVLTSDAFDAARRREHLAAVLEASPLAFQLPEWERNEWLKLWSARVDALNVHGAGANDESLEVAWARLKERSGLADLSNGLPAAPDRGPDRATAWLRGGADGALTLAPGRAGVGLGRWLLAAAIAVAGFIAWRSPEKLRSIAALAKRWPALLGVVAGFAWWMWLTPSLIGLAIVALSLAALLKMRQLRLSSRDIDARVDRSATTAPLTP